MKVKDESDDDDEKNETGDKSIENTTEITRFSTSNVIDSVNVQKVLSKTKKHVACVIACALFEGFSYSARFAVFYLYAREFPDATEHSIAWVLWAGSIVNTMSAGFYPCLSDVIGYDKAIIIKLVIRCIGVLGECITMNFAFLSVSFIVGQMNIFAVCAAYIVWIMPHNYAVKYMSYLFGGYAAVYLAGPIIAGLLSHFISYRSLFWCTFILNIIMVIFAFIFISKKQRILELEQMALKQEFDELNIDKSDIFPIILHGEDERSDFRAFWSSISKFEWFQLINVIIQNSLALSAEKLFIVYYLVFLKDNFGSNNIIGTTQLVCACSGFIIGNGITPAIINNKKLVNHFNNTSFTISALSSIMMIILCIILFPLIKNINIFYIIDFFMGLFLGLTVMSTETVILKHQPTQHSGKIGGIKESSRQLIPAAAVLCAGILYAQNIKYAFVYVSGACYGISLVFSIVFMLCQRYKFV